MPRTLLFEVDRATLDFFEIPDEITLEIWGKESLKGSDPPGTKTIVHGEDRSITLSPALQAVFTNEDTGETLTFGITGVSHTTGNTTKATGHNLLGDVGDPDGPELVITRGNFTYSVDEDGNPSSLAGHGQETSLIDYLRANDLLL